MTERDAAAWAAICRWPEAAGVPSHYEGVDMAQVSRFLLWDRVGRAVRRAIGGSVPADDHTRREDVPATREPAAVDRLPAPLRRMRAALARSLARKGRAVLYCPFAGSRHARLIDALVEHASTLAIALPQNDVWRWPGALPFASRDLESSAEDNAFADNLVAGIVKGLAAHDVALDPRDAESLVPQVAEQCRTVREARASLEHLRPNGLLVPGDNHSPFMEWVLVARDMGIPVILSQHGMDCEHHCLSEAYASHIACWGEGRRERYKRESTYQPTMAITGNPFYDALVDARDSACEVNTWLWVTRPHTTEKCFLASRHPDEGVQILDALLDALEERQDARLLIKPHSFDDSERYVSRIQDRGLEVRAEIVNLSVVQLVAEASVVITEDSTAGMDAMLLGRPLVHAHFAQCPPVMSFVASGAALPGFTPEELRRSVVQAERIQRSARTAMLDAQQQYLDVFAGPRDGGASRRFAEFAAQAVMACA
jgi:UDP-N-acetylglucosamine 2-epimerase